MNIHSSHPPPAPTGERPWGRQLGDLARMGVEDAARILHAMAAHSAAQRAYWHAKELWRASPEFSRAKPRGALASKAANAKKAANKAYLALQTALREAHQRGEILHAHGDPRFLRTVARALHVRLEP